MFKILAIDIGTTHCKAVTVNETGEVKKFIQLTCNTIQNEPGQSEQNPEDIFQIVLSLIKQTLEANKNISAICFSAAMHSIIAVDANAKPLTNAFTWADTRSKLQADKLLKNKNANKVYKHTGTPN